MLAYFSHRSARRRTVWLTLIAWTLALLAGMVNACLLQPQGSRALAEPGHHADAAALGHPPADAGKAGCLKFCDEGSSTVGKGNAAQLDVPDPVVFVRVEWAPTKVVDVAARERCAQPRCSHGPPLVIRFLRLTI